jgi:hypothetical protein
VLLVLMMPAPLSLAGVIKTGWLRRWSRCQNTVTTFSGKA